MAHYAVVSCSVDRAGRRAPTLCVCVKMASTKSRKVQKFPKGQQKAAKRSINVRVDVLEGDGQPKNVKSI